MCLHVELKIDMLSLTLALPSGTRIPRVLADEAHQRRVRLLQSGEVCQAGGERGWGQ